MQRGVWNGWRISEFGRHEGDEKHMHDEDVIIFLFFFCLGFFRLEQKKSCVKENSEERKRKRRKIDKEENVGAV